MGVKRTAWRWLVTVTLMAAASAPAPARAQEAQTLIRGGVDSGGFGGPVFRFTEVDDRFGFMMGFRGGWIVDHTFVIGAGVYGLANTSNFDHHESGIPGFRNQLYMGYGGLELEWVIAWQRVVHLSLQALVGAGGVGFDNPEIPCCTDQNADAFFVFEPGANIMLNVHKVFRLGLGGSYRLVRDVRLAGLDNQALEGPAGVVTLKFGSF